MNGSTQTPNVVVSMTIGVERRVTASRKAKWDVENDANLIAPIMDDVETQQDYPPPPHHHQQQQHHQGQHHYHHHQQQLQDISSTNGSGCSHSHTSGLPNSFAKKDDNDSLVVQLQAQLSKALLEKEDGMLEIHKLKDQLRASEKTVKRLTAELKTLGQQSVVKNSRLNGTRCSRRKKNESSRKSLSDDIKTFSSVVQDDALMQMQCSMYPVEAESNNDDKECFVGEQDDENSVPIDEKTSTYTIKQDIGDVDEREVTPKRRRILPRGEDGEIIRPKCTICSKAFSNYSKLEQHMRLHTGEKPFNCTLCDKAYRLKFQLQQHIRTHQEEKPYTCSVCGKGFAANSVLWVHMRTHSGVKPFQCSVCPKTFLQSAHLSQHARTHTGHKPFPCSICSKSFKQKAHLVQHERVHSGEKPFQCYTCGRNFSGSSHLNRHMKIHTGEKPHACFLCSKAFSEPAYLTRHMKIHSSEKPHKCSVCQKAFRVKYNLTQHMRTHKEQRTRQTNSSKADGMVQPQVDS